jgi:programmed cell death protein 5
MPDEIQDAEQMKKIDLILYRILTPEARERINNVRLVNLEKYFQVASLLVNASQQGKIDVPIDDLTLKQVLMQAINNRDFNIVRK